MKRNNNSNQNAVVRLAKLPVVRSACALVSVLYSDTKFSNPCIKSLCEVVENGVKTITSVAYDRAAPVFVKLEPQLTIVNDLACKSLDKLEYAFPALHQPAEEIAASAKSMMLEAKDMISIAANGTMDCVLYTVSWVVERMQVEADPTRMIVDDEAVNLSPLKRAIDLASEGLDSAMSVSEALVDQVFSPTNAEMEEEVKAVEGFEVTTVGSSFSVRLLSLTAKLCRRAYHQARAKMPFVKVFNSLSPRLVQQVQASWILAMALPQHQAVIALFCVTQNFNCTMFQDNFPSRVNVHLYTALVYMVHNTPFNWLVGPSFLPQAASNGRKRRPAKKPVCNHGCYGNYKY